MATSGTTVTLTDALDNDSTSGSVVYTYTTTASRPMTVLEGFIHIQASDTDIPLGKVARTRYNRLSVKSSQGLTTQFYYDPQVATPDLYVWPTGQDERNYLVLFTQRTLDDFDSATDSPDYPQEWFLPLAINLAVLLAPKFGLPAQEYRELHLQAETWYDRAREFDDEHGTSIYFQPDFRGEDI